MADLVADIESIVVAGSGDEVVKGVLDLQLLGGVGVDLVLLHAHLTEHFRLNELVLVPILERQILTVRALAGAGYHADVVLRFHFELDVIFGSS